MRNDESRSKRTPMQFSLHRQRSGKMQPALHGEGSILELISMGACLPDILNKLCAAIDFQIGNVVSVIWLGDNKEHDLSTVTCRAQRYGLHVFWLASIPLQDEDILGYFEMYCSVSRTPTQSELQLIQRVTHLAALAIQRHKGEVDFVSTDRERKNPLRSRSPEGSQLN
jgi:hypothetical protein